jgi:hypothetical protein
MYERHWLRLLGSAGKIQDTRVGSFNTGSGAFLSAITAGTTIFSGMPFEVHGLLDPAEKDRALDSVIKDLRVAQEVPIWAIPQGNVYSLGPDIYDVLSVRYFSDPTDSLNLGEHVVQWWKLEHTATGNQLRINQTLQASYQLILEALTSVSLGAGDLATVNIPSDDMVLWGATARCYWLLGRKAPAQEAGQYAQEGQRAAREYTRLAQRFQPVISRKIQLDEVY